MGFLNYIKKKFKKSTITEEYNPTNQVQENIDLGGSDADNTDWEVYQIVRRNNPKDSYEEILKKTKELQGRIYQDQHGVKRINLGIPGNPPLNTLFKKFGGVDHLRPSNTNKDREK